MKDPAEIYQTWLDTVTAAIMGEDDATILSWFGRPFLMRTADAQVLIETDEDMLQDVNVLRSGIAAQGATHFIRLVQKARYLSEDYIEGWHVSHMLRGAVAVVPPYRNRLVLHRDGDIWRCTEADHQLSNPHFPIHLPRVDTDAFVEKWAEPMADIRATHARAEPLYKAFVEELDRAINTTDPESWSSLYRFPLEMHLDKVDRILNDPAELIEFFDHYYQIRAEHPDAELRRDVKYAEFFGSDRVIGYHDATIWSGDQILFGPVRSRMILSMEEGAWKCSAVTNSLSNAEFPVRTPKTSTELRTMREITERMRK